MHACIQERRLRLHADSTCRQYMHAVHAYTTCILTLHAYTTCIHYMHTLHAYTACIHCMHTLHAYRSDVYVEFALLQPDGIPPSSITLPDPNPDPNADRDPKSKPKLTLNLQPDGTPPSLKFNSHAFTLVQASVSTVSALSDLPSYTCPPTYLPTNLLAHQPTCPLTGLNSLH